MSKIEFGTDGWRAVLGEDFNKENVLIAVKAIAKYVFETFGSDKKIIIGYDPRNKADEFAKLTAKTLADYGFIVFLSDKILPTPVLAFNAREMNACAIMFTASHNPAQYLGLKFIPDYAGPATSDITDKIVNNLDKNFEAFGKNSYMEMDFSEKYFEHIKSIIDFEKIKTLDKELVYDALYSAGIGYFDKLLDEFEIEYKSLHNYHDPEFGGNMPDPKPKYLKDLMKYVLRVNKAVGFSNDGDADRFGVVNEAGQYVSPNEIIVLLLRHLIKNKKMSGCLVKTVGASLLLDKIAQKEGIKIIDTPVGFKYVGEAMRKYNPIIAGEESGGLSIQGHIPEKDGILANLLILEMLAYEDKLLLEMQMELKEEFGNFFNERVDLKLEDKLEVAKMLNKFTEISSLCKLTVIKKDVKDGIKLYFKDNSSWILVRPSGTEPLIRIYIESNSEEKIQQFKKELKI